MRWSYNLKAGRLIHEAIENEDPMGVIDALRAAYNELFTEGLIDADDCDRYLEDLEFYEAEDDDIADSADFELDNFYDLCDALQVWVIAY